MLLGEGGESLYVMRGNTAGSILIFHSRKSTDSIKIVSAQRLESSKHLWGIKIEGYKNNFFCCCQNYLR